jgi:hypothetical protein
MMSESELKQKLEKEGYSNINLQEETTGSEKGWKGTAMKDGKEVNIRVSQNGTVTEE